jgi:hypothetical protein
VLLSIANLGVEDTKGFFMLLSCSLLLAAKAQAASGREEIATVAAEINPDELEIPAKKHSILVAPKEANMKQIDLCTSDPSKMATISAHLSIK